MKNGMWIIFLIFFVSPLNAMTVSVPKNNCGVNGTIEERILNCNTRYLGAPNYEGDWVLVSKIDNFQIWRDERTGLIWSDRVETESKHYFNSCEASANAEIEGELPYCTKTKTSVCEERQEFSSAIPNEKWKRAIYSNSKGQMGKNSNTSVTWKLPSRMDFRTASINGATSVLPRLNAGLWTSSFYSNINSSSYFAGVASNGRIGFALESRDSTMYVRCVGNPSL